VWCHSIYCHLDLGSEWWTQVSFPVTVCNRKPSPEYPSLFLSLCVHLLAFMAPRDQIPWNS
jgi:hypothetical protein